MKYIKKAPNIYIFESLTRKMERLFIVLPYEIKKIKEQIGQRAETGSGCNACGGSK